MMSCEALIFDVDGTLADTEEVHRQAFNLAFGACRLDWIWEAPLYGELLGVTGGKERIASYIDRLQVPATERRGLNALIPEIHRAKTRLYRELIRIGHVRPRTGVRRLVMEARDAGIRVALASTTSPENIEPLLTAGFGSQALNWFDTIATGDVVANKKPAPDIYNVALKSLGVHPARAIAVEDSAIGVTSAKAAGLFTVATPNMWTRTQDFTAADLLLGSLGDPAEPLEPADERRLGARFLSLERLAALHAAAQTGVAHAQLTERIRAVAFDLDGTLIDTMGDLAAAVNLMLSMLGGRELPESRIRALVGNGVDQLVVRALNESVGTSPTHAAQRSAALALFRRLYGQGLFKRSKVYPGVVQALRSLADAGTSLCCITNKDSVFAEPLLREAGLSEFFSFTLCADRAEDRKPSPNMLLAACSRLGIAPAEMLYVGDSSMDIAAARAAGSPVVAVSYGYGKDHADGAGDVLADGRVADLAELVALCLRPPADQPHLKLYNGGSVTR